MNDKKREDQKYLELLQKLRTSQIGVQVLFAFLLTVPFSQRSENLVTYQQILLVTALMFTAFSAILHIAPVSHHFILAGEGLKIAIVEYANTISRAAVLFMVLGMLVSIFLFIDFIFSLIAASAITLVWLIFSIIFLYVVPLKLRQNNESD